MADDKTKLRAVDDEGNEHRLMHFRVDGKVDRDGDRFLPGCIDVSSFESVKIKIDHPVKLVDHPAYSVGFRPKKIDCTDAIDAIAAAAKAMRNLSDTFRVIGEFNKQKEQEMSQMTKQEIDQTKMKLIDGLPGDWQYNRIFSTDTFNLSEGWVTAEVIVLDDRITGTVFAGGAEAYIADDGDCPFDVAEELAGPYQHLIEAQRTLDRREAGDE